MTIKAKGHGSTFKSVRELVRATTEDPTLADELDRRIAERHIVKRLFALRNACGLSQQEVAEKLECTQSRISKLESGKDADLRLGEIAAYADSLGYDVRLAITNKNVPIVGQVKHHAFAIKRLLDQLAALAESDESMVKGVASFFSESFFNLVRMMQDSAMKLPLQSDGNTPYVRIDLMILDDEDPQEEDVVQPAEEAASNECEPVTY